MMKKKILLLILGGLLLLGLTACGATEEESAAPPDLTGEWRQTNSESETAYQSATIVGNTIEVYWIDEETETESLYWAGTYIPPTTTEEPYVWESANDTAKTGNALLAATGETKVFTYENDILSYEVSAMGVTTTVQLEQISEEPQREIKERTESIGSGTIGHYEVAMKDAQIVTNDQEGYDMLVIPYDFTNHGTEPISSSFGILIEAYQDGIQLENVFYYAEDELGHLFENASKNVQSGSTIETVCAFQLGESTSPIEVIMTDLAASPAIETVTQTYDPAALQ